MFARELSYALYGAWRLARLDPGGMVYFDRSLEGFWRSFRAAGIVYPLFLIQLGLRVPDADWARAGAARIIAVETIGYVIAWVGFPLAMLPLARALDREGRYLGFMVAYNWSQILQSAAFLFVLGIAASGVPLALGEALLTVAALVLLLYEWYIARVALEVSRLAAAAVVVLDLLVSMLVTRASYDLY